MINQQLLDYIKLKLQQGVNQEEIKKSLMDKSWQAQDIDEAFDFISNPNSHSQSVLSSSQEIASLPSALVIFGKAWTIYKQRIGIFLGIMIIPMLIMIAIPFIFFSGNFFGVSLLSLNSITSGISLFVLLIIIFIISITQVWGQIALLYAIKDSQECISVREAYRRGWHKVFSYWWVSLLVAFITFGGFLLLIIPGIIFLVWFCLALFILIAEDLKGMDALLKSKEYVKGRWGEVFLKLLFIGFVSLLISLVPDLIFAIFDVSYSLKIGNFIVGLFLTPLTMIYLFLIYSNLKALKGKTDFTPSKAKKKMFIFVGILGIMLIPLVIFSTVILSSAREKARDARRQADIRHIQIGLEIYYNERGNYPFSLDDLAPSYLPSMLLDPSTNQIYEYQLQPNGTDYKVCTQLESTKTQECVTSKF